MLHPTWFDVLDVPQEGDDPEAQVRRELEVHAGHVSFSLVPDELPLDLPVTPPLERWVGWMAPYARARLALALGPGVSNMMELERTLLTLDARVHVTEASVAVTFRDAQLPPAIHAAGLARDLVGCTAAGGRDLRFGFE